jgi:hypothetical protein
MHNDVNLDLVFLARARLFSTIFLLKATETVIFGQFEASSQHPTSNNSSLEIRAAADVQTLLQRHVGGIVGRLETFQKEKLEIPIPLPASQHSLRSTTNGMDWMVMYLIT